MYLDSLKYHFNDKLDQDMHKNILIHFQSNLDDIIYTLVKLEIKTEILINNIACLENKEKKENFILKAFIEPQSQYFSVGQNAEKQKDRQSTSNSIKNKENLQYFYLTQKKRLLMQFQQTIEKKFGRQQISNEKFNNPNFVINGTRLIFKKQQPKQRQQKEQPGKQRKQTMTLMNFKQKFEKRIEEIKKVNAGIEQKHFMNKQPIITNILSMKQKEECFQQNQPAHFFKGTKITNFDQSFEQQFKPEEFTKENTFLLEQNQYLDQLEYQIINLHSSKKHENHSSELKKEQIQQKSMEKNEQIKGIGRADLLKGIESNEQIKLKGENETNTSKDKQLQKSTKSVNSNNNNSSLSGSNLTQEKIITQQNNLIIKTEKVNKYKMKIITSHEIQIEGGGQEEPNFQQIEKQILQNIRTGKINLSDLAGQKTNFVSKNVLPKEEKKQLQTKISMQYNSPPSPTRTKSTENIMEIKDSEKVYTSNHETNKNNIKSIHEIMQKIGKKNTIKKVQNIPSDLDQEDYVNVPVAVAAVQKSNENESKPIVNINAVRSPNNTSKPEKIQIMQQKLDKPENYLIKIRQAKLKAENVLKEYTKKKQ